MPLLSACGRISAPGDRVRTIPHGVDWVFANCLACHTSGDIALPILLHPTNPTNEDCLNPGCHSVETTTTTLPPTTTPPTTTTTTTPPTTTPSTTTTTITTTPPTTTAVETPQPPAANHKPYKDTTVCFICHVGSAAVHPVPETHAGYANNSCLDEGCHVLPE